MTDPLPLRIFLAAPGDCASERSIVSDCVNQWNEELGDEANIRFEVIGWEQRRGTALRPQEAINELIRESHFLIALFKGSWGSEPGSPWGYTSGTEEELFTGLLELGQGEQPMRDIWVAFVEGSSPAPEIVALRNQMESSHALMYEATIDQDDLTTKLVGRLSAWATTAGRKVPRHVDLVPSSGVDVLGAANLRLRGEKLIQLGEAEAGRTALREAASLGGPTELLAYARLLARQGDFGEALDVTQKAISHYASGDATLYSVAAAEAFAAKADVLRRRGHGREALGTLQHALELLDRDDAYAQRIRGRILDQLALAAKAVGEPALARDYLNDALTVKRDSGSRLAECNTLINLARLEVGEGNLDEAEQLSDQVIAALLAMPPSALHGNAHTLAAQVLLRQGRPDEAREHAEVSLSINRQLGHRRGEAISLYVLAQCCKSAGRDADAVRFAQESLAINHLMGDYRSADKPQWIIDHLTR